jgi:hypothetical protein
VGVDDLDDTIDRNSFTVEQAAEVFKKAAEAVKTSDGETLKKLMDAGFDILKFILA